MKRIKNKRVIAIAGFFMILFTSGALAQEGSSRPLKIGDQVPDLAFKMLRHSASSAHLSDFKNKLIILDFWSTSCGACITAFPKMEALQQKFGDNVQVILANENRKGFKEEEIHHLFSRLEKEGKKITLPVALHNPVADTLFPHETIPQYVWINKDRKVLAITNSTQVTDTNITSFLKWDSIELIQKVDYYPDKILNIYKNMLIEDATYNVAFKRGMHQGLPGSGARVRKINDKDRGVSLYNLSIEDMYRFLLAHFRRDLANDKKRTLIEVADLSRINFNYSQAIPEKWKQDNLYTYDLAVPTSFSDRVFNTALSDLNKFLPYMGEVVTRSMKCYSLRALSTANKFAAKKPAGSPVRHATDSSVGFDNVLAERMISDLRLLSFIQFPLVNDLAYEGKIDYCLPTKIKDMESLKKILNDQGFDLMETVKELEVFVVRDRKE